MSKIRVAFFILLFALLAASGYAAEKPGPMSSAKETILPAEQEKAPEDPLGRSNPQGTVIGFLKAASQEDYDRALQYLDTKKKGPDAQKLVHALRVVLERGSSGKQAVMSAKPEGHLDDGLPPNKERIGTVETSSGSLDILLERVQRANNPPIWLFSAETLAKVPEVYEGLDVRTLEDYLPKFLVNTWVLWFPLWRWLAILLVVPLTFILATLLTRLITSLLLLYSRRKINVMAEKRAVRLAGPIRILVFASAIWVISMFSRSMLTAAFLAYMAATLAVIGATWLCLRLIEILFEIIKLRDRGFDKLFPAINETIEWGPAFAVVGIQRFKIDGPFRQSFHF